MLYMPTDAIKIRLGFADLTRCVKQMRELGRVALIFEFIKSRKRAVGLFSAINISKDLACRSSKFKFQIPK